MFGLQPQNRGGFNADALMAFVVQGFNSPNGDVRNAAVKVTTEVFKLMGFQVEKFLKGIKSAMREVPPSSSRYAMCKTDGNTAVALTLVRCSQDPDFQRQ